jgi:hypothetical protein
MGEVLGGYLTREWSSDEVACLDCSTQSAERIREDNKDI